MPAAYIVNTTSQAIGQPGATHKELTVAGTAVALLSGFTPNAQTTHVLVQFNDATARVTFDGATDPTATLGFRFVAGTSAYWSIDLARNARVIREGATSVTVEIQELNFR